MTNSAGRVSLFLTLGIAAIDLLCCAFVATIVMVVMFLLPVQSAGGGRTGTEDALIIHWSFRSVHQSILGVELVPPKDTPKTVYSDDPASVELVCRSLSRSVEAQSPCYLILPIESRDLDGLLVIEQPRPGDWRVFVRNVDTTSHMNGANDQPVDLLMTIIGKEATTRQITALSHGKAIEIAADPALHVD